MTKVKDSKENEQICGAYCRSCPTYPGIESELLFCARGASSGPKEKKGCNCPACEVQLEYGCSRTYYCIEGECE